MSSCRDESMPWSLGGAAGWVLRKHSSEAPAERYWEAHPPPSLQLNFCLSVADRLVFALCSDGVDHHRSPSTDLTVPLTTISVSGAPMPRNWTESRFSAPGRHRPSRCGARDQAHHVEAVQDRVRQPDRLGELGIDVDRVEVARGAGVAVRQVLVGGDPQLGDLRRLRSTRPSQTPLTMLVQVPRTTWSPSWLTEMVSKT